VDEAQSAEAARLLELYARWRAMTPLQRARTLAAYIEERMREVRAITAAQAQNGGASPFANHTDSTRP
jgi:type II secretory pathway component PulM